MSWPWVYFCSNCFKEAEIDTERIVCDCGGLLDLRRSTSVPLSGVETTFAGQEYRYGNQLPCRLRDLERVSLGADLVSPFLPFSEGSKVWLKCDQLLPTGSFKDRGAVVLAALAVQHGVKRIVLDSSGNAAASMAAHAARAGIECEIFVPDSTSDAKVRQMRAMGAYVRLVPGPRERAGAVAREAARVTKSFYASHVLNPHFHHGVKTWSFEVFDQLGEVPGTILLPVGNGSLFLGVVLGFRELLKQERISVFPRIIAVQTQAYPSLDVEGRRISDGNLPRRTVAEGVAVSHPARRKQILETLVETQGSTVAVSEKDILDAQKELGYQGFYVEPTGALAWAGYRSLEKTEKLANPVVVALTGSGFKSQK